MAGFVSFLLSRLTHVWLPVWFRDRLDRDQARLSDAQNFPDTRE